MGNPAEETCRHRDVLRMSLELVARKGGRTGLRLPPNRRRSFPDSAILSIPATHSVSASNGCASRSNRSSRS
jgi:hypothetical protein